MAMSGQHAVLLVIVAVALGALVSTGAFSTVAADRAVDISVADDTTAALQLTPYVDEGGQQSEFASIVEGQLQLRINTQSTVDTRSVFNVTNHGSQPVAVWITDVDTDDSVGGVDENNTDDVTFYNPTYGGAASIENGVASIEGRPNAVALGVGETLTVSVYLDTTTVHDQESDLLDSIVIHADANVDGNDTPTDDGDAGSGGDGSTDGSGSGTPDVHPLPNQQLTITSGQGTDVLRVGNLGSGQLYVTELGISGDDADDFEIVDGDAPFSLVAGNGVDPTHSITIAYTGSGHATAQLEIHSNDPDEPVRVVELTGTPGGGKGNGGDGD